MAEEGAPYEPRIEEDEDHHLDHEIFIVEFLRTGKGAEAVRKAGMKLTGDDREDQKRAARLAYKLRHQKHIGEEISRRATEALRGVGIDAAFIRDGVAAIAISAESDETRLKAFGLLAKITGIDKPKQPKTQTLPSIEIVKRLNSMQVANKITLTIDQAETVETKPH